MEASLASIVLQQHARGLLVRAQRRRLVRAASRARKPFQRQRESIAVATLQLAARRLIEQHKLEEVELPSEQLQVDSGKWQHERAQAALERTLADAPARTGGGLLQNPITTVANAIFHAGSRAEARQAFDMPEGEAGESWLVEHCGWLLKQGRALNNWKMRWVIVQGACT